MKHKNHDMIIAYLDGKRIRNVSSGHEFQLGDINTNHPTSIFNEYSFYEIVEENSLATVIPRQGQKVTTTAGHTYVLHYVDLDTMTLINIDWGTSLDGNYPKSATYGHMQARSGCSRFVKIVDVNGKILFEKK